MSTAVKSQAQPPNPKQDRVLNAAQGCFFRYGFRKTTMEEIAVAAGISRPALYLMYKSKEAVFRAVFGQILATLLTDLKDGIDSHPEPMAQLVFAFDVWCVRPYETVQKSPDAADLLDNGRHIAAEEWAKSEAQFENAIRGVLEPIMAGGAADGLSSAEVAHLLTMAIPGFKERAASAAQLRRNIRGLLSLTLAAAGASDRET